MRDVGGRLRGPVVALGTVALLTAGPALPAHAGVSSPPGPVESIPAYDVVLTIGADAVLRVRETITYDFDEGGEHGISRRVPYRRGNRLYEVRDVRASSSTGAPARARTLKLLNDVRISVGERGHRVTGRQAYVIEYEVAKVFTPRRNRVELVWDAVGTAWKVPIGEAAVRVVAPVPLRRASCRAGTPGARTVGTRCLRQRDGRYAIEFTQRGLRPGEGMVIGVRLPKGTMRVPPPEYARPRWTGTWAGTAALGVALGAAVIMARRRPGPRVGEALFVSGALVVLADLADDVVPRGPWAFSFGDPSLAGLGAMIVGASLGYARWSRGCEAGTSIPVDD